MPFAEAESRKDERGEGHRIDRGQLRSGSDENPFLNKHQTTSTKLQISSNDQNLKSQTRPFWLFRIEIWNYVEHKPPLPWRERAGVRGEIKCSPPPTPSPVKGEGSAIILMFRG